MGGWIRGREVLPAQALCTEMQKCALKAAAVAATATAVVAQSRQLQQSWGMGSLGAVPVAPFPSAQTCYWVQGCQGDSGALSWLVPIHAPSPVKPWMLLVLALLVT